MQRPLVSSVSLTCLSSIHPIQIQSSIILLLYYLSSFPPAFPWAIFSRSYCFTGCGWLHQTLKWLESSGRKWTSCFRKLLHPGHLIKSLDFCNKQKTVWLFRQKMGGGRGDSRSLCGNIQCYKKCNNVSQSLIENMTLWPRQTVFLLRKEMDKHSQNMPEHLMVTMKRSWNSTFMKFNQVQDKSK